MRYNFLTNAAKVVEWARGIVTALTQRDVDIDRQLKAITDRLDAGGL